MTKVTEAQLKKYMEKARERKILPLKIINELEEKLINYINTAKKEGKPPLTKKALEKILQQTIKAYHFSQVDPGSAVGTIAAQSIGEPGTQMSIPGNEKIIVSINNETKIIEIGEFVEELFHKYGVTFKDNNGTAILDIPRELEAFVLSLDENEKIRWQPLAQVSRHLPNGDLLKITTRSGRKITATFSHSFVIRKNNKIIPVKGKELKLGDRLPVALKIPIKTRIEYLHLGDILTDNIINNNVSSNQETLLIQSLEKLELTPLLGWFIGIYIAKGSVSQDNLILAIDNNEIIEKILEFVRQNNLSYNIRENTPLGIYNAEIIIHTPLFANFFREMFGTSLKDKTMPGWILNAPEEFIAELLKALFDTNGTVDVSKGIITLQDLPVQLTNIILLLLARLEIFTFKETKKEHTLTIPIKYVSKFIDTIGSDLSHKLTDLKLLVDKFESTNNLIINDSYDVIPEIDEILKTIKTKLGVNIDIFENNKQITRSKLKKCIDFFIQQSKMTKIDISKELELLENAYNSSVVWDEIIKLEKIPSPTPYVYDFSVPGLETFLTSEGVITHNTLQTYHYAGVAEFNVTLGLPRLIEIVDARRNPNTPAMWVYLEKNLRQDQEKAKAVARQLELTKVINVAKSVDIELFENRIRIVLDPELMEDKGLTVDEVVQKLQYRRRQKVFAEGYNIYVQSEKEEPILQDLQRLSEKVKEIPLKGLKGITRAMIKVNRFGEGEDDWEYYIRCEGSNFTGALRIPGVDATRTTTNHIHEIAETLGIEAARAAIIREAKKVLDDQGLDVDTRHISLVADLMTYSGEIHQIGRHGISGEKSSVFARAAFEVTVKHLLDAAIYGQKERLQGIVENVIVGQTIKLGTGIVDLAISPNYREYADKPLNLEEIAEES